MGFGFCLTSVLSRMMKYALFDYVPRRRVSRCSFEQQDVNRRILDFKDGRKYATRWAARVMAMALAAIDLTDVVLMPVPASGPYSHARRYKRFLQQLCATCNAVNGYSHLVVRNHREKVHTSGRYDWCSEQQLYIDVDHDFLRGKKVVVIDDICTTCTTANAFITYLQSAGADVCMALFLAKTMRA